MKKMNCVVLLSVLLMIASLAMSCASSKSSTSGKHPVVDDDTVDDDSVDDDASPDDDDNDDASPDDDDDNDTTPASLPFLIDFESYALGELPAPWTTDVGGTTTVQVANAPAKGVIGHCLEINGGTGSENYGDAALPLADGIYAPVKVSFDMWIAAGASVYMIVYDTVDDTNLAYLVANGASENLYAYNYSSRATSVYCGDIVVAGSSHIEIDLQMDGTYDVLMDGAATPCAGLASEAGADAPITKIDFTDGDGSDFGGITYFDNVGAEIIFK